MSIILGKVQDFISHLGDFKSECIFNPWAETDDEYDNVPDNWINRRLNLEDHLNCEPKFILFGEAPSYQGCRYSGIPFTSERLLFEGHIPRLEYHQGIRLTNRIKPWSEPSATIVWKTLYELGIEKDTVLFNVFPFHPHRENNKFSNRLPATREFKLTQDLLSMAIDLHSGYKIAVGRTAHSKLMNLVTNLPVVRHPANGGAKLFKSQLKEIVEQLS